MIAAELARPLLEHPEWLGPSASVFAIAAVCIAAAKLVERARLGRMPGNASPARSRAWARETVLLAALASICVALLGPRIGERTLLIPDEGADVVFVIDVSKSMSATDVPPTRHDRAKRAVEAVMGRLDAGDRAALAVFAHRGLLLTPLTPDRIALLDLLADIGPDLLERASSNIGSGVAAALDAFETASERPRVVVVVSDGEDSGRGGDLGAAAAARNDARIVALSLGTDAGGHIPDAGGVLRDRAGRPVLTRRDNDGLEALAAATGGRLFIGDEWGRFEFDRVADSIASEATVSGDGIERRVPATRVIPFAAFAFATLLLEGAVPRRRDGTERGGRRLSFRRRRIASAAVLVVAVCFAVGPTSPAPARGVGASALPSPAKIRELEEAVRRSPEDARARIRLGVAHLAIGSAEDAAREFLAATVHAREPSVAATAFFDLGVAALEQGEERMARDAFFDALVIDSTDERARFNLEWTLALLRNARGEEPAPLGRSEESPASDREAPTEEQETRPTPRPDTTTATPDPTRRLSADERRRWLSQVSDDSRNWLRAAADEPPPLSEADTGPVW